MDYEIIKSAIIKYISGLILVGLLLFIPAGTFTYWQAWLLISILFIPMFILGLILIIFNPDLLKKRLNAKEEQKEQKIVIILSILMFLASFIIAGFNFRFKWIILPSLISYIAAIVFLIAYGLYAEVLRENAYLSRIVEIQENQKIIDTGLYGIIRHPMYMSTLFLFLSMPLVLGSILSFIIMLMYIPIIAIRIQNEEIVLEKGLEGYAEYRNKVRYKLIPFIW